MIAGTHSSSEGQRPFHTVVIKLRFEGELPTGRAIGGDRVERPFTGWLGLMGAVQASIAEDQASAERPDRTPEDPLPS